MFRFTLLIAGAAALAVMVVAGAAGGTRPNDRPTHGPGAVGAVTYDKVARPDDRAWLGVGAEPVRPGAVRPDDRAWRGAGPVPTIELTRSPSVRGDGFDWADAGIGAAAALALGLLATTAHMLRRQRIAALQ